MAALLDAVMRTAAGQPTREEGKEGQGGGRDESVAAPLMKLFALQQGHPHVRG